MKTRGLNKGEEGTPGSSWLLLARPGRGGGLLASLQREARAWLRLAFLQRKPGLGPSGVFGLFSVGFRALFATKEGVPPPLGGVP